MFTLLLSGLQASCLLEKTLSPSFLKDSLQSSHVHERKSLVRSQNLSCDFHLLSMPRDRRSFHGLKDVVSRHKSASFLYVY